MKTQLIFLLAALGAQAGLQKRQFGGLGKLLSGGLGQGSTSSREMKPWKVLEVKSEMKREGVKNTRLYFGPLKLLPAAEAAKQRGGVRSDPSSNSWFATLTGFPTNSYILRTNSTLQYENGTLATVNTGVYNHHVIIFDLGKSAPPLIQCGPLREKGRSGMMMPGTYFGGSSTDGAPSLFSTPDGLFNSGHLFGPRSKAVLSAELVNYGTETKNIYIVTEVEYVPGNTPGMMDTTVGIMSVNQCDKIPNPFLYAPAGKKAFTMQSKNITIVQDGFMLSRRGHMHDGGTGILFKVNDKVVCDSKAIYGNGQKLKGDDGKDFDALNGMVECTEPIAVKKGDQIYLEAGFDLNKHPPRKHAHGGGEAEEMALMGFVFAVKKP